MGLGRACPPLLSLSRPGGCTPGRVANPIVREGLVLIVLRGKGQAEGYESRRRERAMSLAEEISNVLEQIICFPSLKKRIFADEC